METQDQLQSRHRKEQRDLQSQITQKKKSASKKTRKGVNSECEDLERHLHERHLQEIAQLNDENHELHGDEKDDLAEQDQLDQGASPASDPTEAPAQPIENTTDGSTAANSANGQPAVKRNRQKERLARRAAEQEAAAIEAEREAASQPDWKRTERTSMLKAFAAHGLEEKEIQPDGHCLFSAVADQLQQAGIPLRPGAAAAAATGGSLPASPDSRYRAVRGAAARHMESHPDDFAPFLDEPLGGYVDKIRDTAEWGGQLELMALAREYRVEICVLQEGRVERIAPAEGGGDAPGLEKIWLAYYRHGYGLGEHYNSLRKLP